MRNQSDANGDATGEKGDEDLPQGDGFEKVYGHNGLFEESVEKVDQSLALTPGRYLRNCPQYLITLSQATGIPSTLPYIDNIFRSIEAGCPAEADINKLSVDNVSAFAQLSLGYCHEYAAQFVRTKSVRGISFDVGIDQNLRDSQMRLQLYGSLYRELWGRDRQLAPDLRKISTSLDAVVDTILASTESSLGKENEVQLNRVQNMGVIEALCAVFLIGSPKTSF
jgi:hypothetical protein